MTQVEKTTVRRRKGAPKLEEFSGRTPAGQSVSGISGRKPGELRSLKGVLFGPPKTGKTTLACSGKNILLISLDPDGSETETLDGRDDIVVVEPESQADLDHIIRSLHTTDRGRFDWVVVDSLTFLFQMLGGKDILETYVAGRDIRRAYGQAGAGVNQIIHDLVVLKDQNVIFTAHLQKDQDDDPSTTLDTKLGESEVKVAVTPMVWKLLGPAVSFIGRTYKESTYEDVMVDGKRKRNKKTRYGVSYNDGERSPAGSRLKMLGDYDITPTTLDELASELLGGN